ncbi:MAG TPA: hypothetical protein VFK43_18095, partial [Acidimicrobiales bacterium]|nr:hypothetical protein [Acidimicrobiales bacterium]
TWSNAPLALDGYAKANLSMRNASRRSGAGDTYLTLGKGGRSAAPPGAGPFDWAALRGHDAGLRHGGTLGTLGQALQDGGRRWSLASDDARAAPMAATAAGTVPATYPGTGDGVRRALQAQPHALLVAVPHWRLPETIDLLGGLCTLVVSASTPAGNRSLGVLAVSSRCELGTAGLASPSTHRAHLATLPDVSATFLDLLALPVPASVTGGPVAPAGAVDRSDLVERGRRSWTADRARMVFVPLFVVFHVIGAVVAVRRRRARPLVAAALMAIPPASFLMMLLPWWRVGIWGGVVAGGVLAGAIGFAGALIARRDVTLAAGALAALTAAVVGVDALFASPLQVDAPFGNSPIGAGRFFGVGNIGSGFLVAGLLLAGGLAIDRWGRRAVPSVGAALVLGAVAGGAPGFGSDVGGVLFAVPAYGLLLLGARHRRLRARHVVALAGLAVVAVVLFAAVDLVRDAGTQTHLAKSVGGPGLGDEVMRKGLQALTTVAMPFALVVPIAAVVFIVTRLFPGRDDALRFISSALVAAAVLGSLLNDSGVMVAAAVAAVGWPAGVAVASDRRRAADTSPR